MTDKTPLPVLRNLIGEIQDAPGPLLNLFKESETNSGAVLGELPPEASQIIGLAQKNLVAAKRAEAEAMLDPSADVQAQLLALRYAELMKLSWLVIHEYFRTVKNMGLYRRGDSLVVMEEPDKPEMPDFLRLIGGK